MDTPRESILRPAIASFLVLSVLAGIVYPLAVTGAARVLFPWQAAGSLVMRDGKAIGSDLIGQNFSDPKDFWGRPSATSPMPYNGTSSGGSNLGPLNPALVDAVKGRIDALRAADPGNTAPVPVDLVTASGSGLDPHISPAAARYQITRVARVRGVAPGEVSALVEQNIETPWLPLIGEPVVNVLRLNLALDALHRAPG